MVRSRVSSILVLSGLMAVSVPAVAQGPDSISQALEGRRSHYADIAQQIWNFAEVGYQEQRSSELLQSELRLAGFEIESGVAGMPTAFVAELRCGFTCHRHPRGVRRPAGDCTKCCHGACANFGTSCRARMRVTTSLEQGRRQRRSRPENGWSRPGPKGRFGCTALPPKKGGPARSTWSAPECSKTWTPCWPGIRAMRTTPAPRTRSPISPPVPISRLSRHMRPPRAIKAVRRWMAWKR